MATQPGARDLHVDTLLTNLSIGYRNTSYIADMIFPIVPVMKQSDLIPEYDQSHWFRDAAELRGPGTASRGGGWTIKHNQTYFCNRFSYRKEISDEDRDNTDRPYDLDAEATEFVTDKMQLRRERSFAANFFKTGVWGADKTGGVDFSRWSDYGSSTPLEDLTDFRDEVETEIGREPNTFVISKQVWNKLKWHPAIIDLIKHTQRGQVSVDLFASLVEIERVLIGKAIHTTDPEGTAEANVTYSRVWGKHGLLIYVPPRPTLRTPAAGYTFVWQRVPNAIQYIKRMRNEEREVDIVEGNSYFDQKVTSSRAGLFLNGAVA